MKPDPKFREFDRRSDGNVFRWIIDEAQRVRTARFGRTAAVLAARREAFNRQWERITRKDDDAAGPD